ncbi:MAG: M20 metallopeptidase family protein [Anaerovoracaceae bacterium]|jgi:amidohydrolase
MEDSKLLSLMAKYRRDLHRIPELGYQEKETGAYIKKVLEDMQCRVQPVVNTSVLAYFDFGRPQTLAFRGDMDGLPIREKTGLDFASGHAGLMHACGHDGHMANLLGFAHVVDEMKKSGRDVPFNALLIFQPAEEIILGARDISASGILDAYHVRNIYGMHLWPTVPAGVIASRPGYMMSRSTEVNVDIKGRSAHCAVREKGIDSLLAGCRFIESIYDYRAREISERCVVSFGRMESGEVRNAVAANTHIEGSLRTFSEETWQQLTGKMHAIARGLEEEMGVEITVDHSKEHQTVNNDEELYRAIRPVLDSLDFHEMEEPDMISEDFSFYQRRRPGVFFFTGTGSGIPLHSNNYDFDEKVLLSSVHLFERLFLFAKQ